MSLPSGEEEEERRGEERKRKRPLGGVTSCRCRVRLATGWGSAAVKTIHYYGLTKERGEERDENVAKKPGGNVVSAYMMYSMCSVYMAGRQAF